MQGKKDVIDILNEALKHELGAVSQYWLHYRMLDNWGFTKLAKKERKELIEEMQHADKLVARIIFLEGLPNLQYIAPLMIGQNLKEVLECDLKGEFNARDLYTRAREICRKNEDLVSMQLFEELLKDEEGHIDFLETQLDLMDKIGVQNYGQLQADAADEVEGKRDHPSSRTRGTRYPGPARSQRCRAIRIASARASASGMTGGKSTLNPRTTCASDWRRIWRGGRRPPSCRRGRTGGGARFPDRTAARGAPLRARSCAPSPTAASRSPLTTGATRCSVVAG